MNINVELEHFQLPVYVKRDNEYYSNLESYFKQYLEHIGNIYEISDECKRRIRDNCKTILKCILQYYDANIFDAEQNIEAMLKNYLKSPFIVATISDNYAFRGVSPDKIRPSVYATSNRVEYDEMMAHDMYFFRSRISIERFDRKEMLHIPFDNRGVISTQRFSIPGIPCMYFSTTTLGTWLETDMPDIKTFQVSSYDVPASLKVLNLCIQQYLIDGSSSFISTEQEKQSISDFLEIFPLVVASSYRIFEAGRVFKSEYIISQMIMQAARNLGIDGVAYLSKRMDDYYAYPHGVNLAIMMPCNGNTKQKYWNRISEIKLSKPYFITDITSNLKQTDYSTFINKFYSEHIQGNIQIAGNTFKYTTLNFSDFDEFLWIEHKEPFCK